ncbi:MAG TPA: hypothetical protein VF389_11745 [Woeseiaceae bacterium]
MAKPGRNYGEDFLQRRSRMAREKHERETAAEPLVTPEAEQHGDYRDHSTLGRANERPKINRGGSTIERWIASDAFTEGEVNAIRGCQVLWLRSEGKSSLVAPPSGGRGLWMGGGQQAAIDELNWFEAKLPKRFWLCFVDICRHEKTAADAGHNLGTNTRDQCHGAKMATQFCAAMIARWRGL